MGFETKKTSHKLNSSLIIKQSLWDLKQLGSRVDLRSVRDNKAVPMGFETLFSLLVFC